jgi:hypothetical protein
MAIQYVIKTIFEMQDEAVQTGLTLLREGRGGFSGLAQFH